MFIWNMLGAVILIPALSHFLLRNAFGKRGAENVRGILRPSAVID